MSMWIVKRSAGRSCRPRKRRSRTSAKRTRKKNKRGVITLQNGCICCTLLGDLIQEIDHIQAMGQFNCIIIKSTGITEPQQVAESSCVEPATMALATQNDKRSEQQDQENEASTSTLKMVNMLNKYVRLETCVTAVGAANFP
mmetsp:Transcript_11419/g.20174  ORF Transcript_11419/g.20174 Transcript_11419/m.20174 type:complete len:142 (-) Transcript_11419:178-603(-)